MFAMQGMKEVGLAALLLALAGTAQSTTSANQSQVVRRYRDLKVYTTSAPDKGKPAHIVARTQFVNEGPAPLRIAARLGACPALAFKGARFTGDAAPGKSVVWRWSFTAPAKLAKRQILTGSVAINGKAERDLYISVQGKDPAKLKDDGLEKITESARVVATYGPRTQRSVDAEMAARKASQPKPLLTLAANGKTDYSIVLEAEPASKDEVIGDLQRIIKLQSGAELAIKTEADGPAIILRRADLGAAAKGLYDAYRLKTEGKNVIIEASTPEGLRNGVYGLLTDHLGCNWFQPNALGEEIPVPSDNTVRLPRS